MINITSDTDDITLDSTDIKEITRTRHEELYVNTFYKRDEINKSLKDTNCQSSFKAKQITVIALYL